jgi:hypothetical protein
MPAASSSSKPSPELPSLTHTNAGTSSSTPMPASPKDNGGEGVEEAKAAVDVEELVGELKEGTEDDPDVSELLLSSTIQRTRRRVGKGNQYWLSGWSEGEMRLDECGVTILS